MNESIRRKCTRMYSSCCSCFCPCSCCRCCYYYYVVVVVVVVVFAENFNILMDVIAPFVLRLFAVYRLPYTKKEETWKRNQNNPKRKQNTTEPQRWGFLLTSFDLVWPDLRQGAVRNLAISLQ